MHTKHANVVLNIKFYHAVTEVVLKSFAPNIRPVRILGKAFLIYAHWAYIRMDVFTERSGIIIIILITIIISFTKSTVRDLRLTCRK